MERPVARFTARFPNSEVVLLVLLVNHVFFSSELRRCSQSAQTSDLLTIENAAGNYGRGAAFGAWETMVEELLLERQCLWKLDRLLPRLPN
jgi:hypothetical protein